MGYFGFGSTANSDIDLANAVDGGNIDIMTTGAGSVNFTTDGGTGHVTFPTANAKISGSSTSTGSFGEGFFAGNVSIAGANSDRNPTNLSYSSQAPLTLYNDVDDGGTTPPLLKLVDTDADTTANTKMVILFSKAQSAGSFVDAGSIETGITSWGGSSGNRHTYMSFNTVFDGSNAERLRITDTGRLTVGGNFTNNSGVFNIAPSSGTAPTMYFEQYTSATDGTLGEISFGNRAVDGQLALIQVKNDGANDSAYMAFHTEVTSGALTERVRIQSDGATLFSGQIHLGSTNQFRIYSEGSG